MPADHQVADSNISNDEKDLSPSYTAHYSEPRWIAGEIMLLLISIVTIYVFSALMYYSWRFRHMARVSGSGQELRERYLHYSCAAVILMAVTRCVLHQVIVFIPKEGHDLTMCRSMMIASRVVYGIATSLTYVHLWLRQHMFYTKADLKQLRSRVLEVVDWLMLVTIICTSAVLAFIAFVPLEGIAPATAYHKNKCNVFEYTSKPSLFLYAGLSLLYQLILLALYIYPIVMQKIHQRAEKKSPLRTTPASTATGYPALWIGIRRGFILAVIVIVTDAASGVLVWFLTKQFPDLLSSIIALNDVNLIINVICCICTFRNWRKIVFGFPVCRRMGWHHHDESLRTTKRGSVKRAMGIQGDEASISSDKAISASESIDGNMVLGKISV